MSRHIATAVTTAVVATILLTGAAASSASAPGKQPPANLSLPTISGTALVGQSLSAAQGTWSGKTLTYAFQWLSCNASGASCSAIGGATASTYRLPSGYLGATVRMMVTA